MFPLWSFEALQLVHKLQELQLLGGVEHHQRGNPDATSCSAGRSDEPCHVTKTPVAVDSGKFSPRKELKLRLVKDFSIPLDNCTPIPSQIFLPTLSLLIPGLLFAGNGPFGAMFVAVLSDF